MAAHLCRARGSRLTPIRQQVLEQLWLSDGPLGAYDLMDRLTLDKTRPVAPPTVYRALDFLMAEGLVSKIQCINAYAPCIHPERPHDCLFFICRDCGKAEEWEEPAIGTILQSAATDLGFVPDRQVVEVEGTCQHCTGTSPTASAMLAS